MTKKLALMQRATYEAFGALSELAYLLQFEKPFTPTKGVSRKHTLALESARKRAVLALDLLRQAQHR